MIWNDGLGYTFLSFILKKVRYPNQQFKAKFKCKASKSKVARVLRFNKDLKFLIIKDVVTKGPYRPQLLWT